MKQVQGIQKEEFQQQADALVLEVLGRVPFLKVKRVERPQAVSGPLSEWRVSVEADGRRWNLMVVATMPGHPRHVMNGCLVLKDRLEKAKGAHVYGVMVAPFLSAVSARLCTDAGMGYLDLAGNALLSFDKVYIERQATDNPFKEKRSLQSLFTAKAGRVLRVLLTPPLRSWKVVELMHAAQVSIGQVSNVRKLLLDRQWASVDDEGVRVTKPEALARAWQAAYELRPLSRETAYTVLHGQALEDATLAALAEADGGAHAVLASYSAALWYAPYIRQATRFFYADKKGKAILKRHLNAQTVERGENVVLLEPREDDVFAGRVEASPGIWCTGLVQTCLDISNGGDRGAEAADHLLQEKLLPAWKKGAV